MTRKGPRNAAARPSVDPAEVPDLVVLLWRHAFPELCEADLRARAAAMARKSRGLDAGSDPPSFTAACISRASLVNAWARFLSCPPLRCMMLANLEWPAMDLV